MNKGKAIKLSANVKIASIIMSTNITTAHIINMSYHVIIV